MAAHYYVCRGFSWTSSFYAASRVHANPMEGEASRTIKTWQQGHTYGSTTQEAEAGDCCVFEANEGYRVRPPFPPKEKEKIAKDTSAENKQIRCSTLVLRQIQIKITMHLYISTRTAESKSYQ